MNWNIACFSLHIYRTAYLRSFHQSFTKCIADKRAKVLVAINCLVNMKSNRDNSYLFLQTSYSPWCTDSAVCGQPHCHGLYSCVFPNILYMQFALVLAALELRQKTYNVNAKAPIDRNLPLAKKAARMAWLAWHQRPCSQGFWIMILPSPSK